jgi:hypothetical protein
MAKSPPIHRWRIVRTPATTIGYVEAPDADTAMEQAIVKFNIDRRLVGKLVAEKIKVKAHRKP